jgi:hypothetical protein
MRVGRQFFKSTSARLPPFFFSKFVSDALMIFTGNYAVLNLLGSTFSVKGIAIIVLGLASVGGFLFLDLAHAAATEEGTVQFQNMEISSTGGQIDAAAVFGNGSDLKADSRPDLDQLLPITSSRREPLHFLRYAGNQHGAASRRRPTPGSAENYP